MATQTGLDVCDRHCGSESGQRAAERTRGVPLDNEEIGTPAKLGQHRGRDAFNVAVRIFLTRAVEPSRPKSAQSVVGGIKLVLAGQDQRRSNASRRQGPRNRCKLNRFGSGADDQPDVRTTQRSP